MRILLIEIQMQSLCLDISITFIIQTEHATRISPVDGPTNKWMRAFLLRHPSISERQAENMNDARVSMSTRAVVDEFNDLFYNVLSEHDLVDKPERVHVGLLHLLYDI